MERNPRQLIKPFRSKALQICEELKRHSEDRHMDITIVAEALYEAYKQGWEDGMSEGTEHAEQIQQYKEKYE